MYSRDFMALIYQWVIENTEYEKITGECPVIYPQVIKFCTDCGMVEEGTNRRSWLKGGKIHDQTRIGITKDEIISFLGETTLAG